VEPRLWRCRPLSDQTPLQDRNPSCAFAVNADDSAPLFPTNQIEQQLCQALIGMAMACEAPRLLGSP